MVKDTSPAICLYTYTFAQTLKFHILQTYAVENWLPWERWHWSSKPCLAHQCSQCVPAPLQRPRFHHVKQPERAPRLSHGGTERPPMVSPMQHEGNRWLGAIWPGASSTSRSRLKGDCQLVQTLWFLETSLQLSACKLPYSEELSWGWKEYLLPIVAGLESLDRHQNRKQKT